jgi:hypothetical protein
MDQVRNHQVAQATHPLIRLADRLRDHLVAATRMGRVVSSTLFSVLLAVAIQVAEVVVLVLEAGPMPAHMIAQGEGDGMIRMGRVILEAGVSKLIEV